MAGQPAAGQRLRMHPLTRVLDQRGQCCSAPCAHTYTALTHATHLEDGPEVRVGIQVPVVVVDGLESGAGCGGNTWQGCWVGATTRGALPPPPTHTRPCANISNLLLLVRAALGGLTSVISGRSGASPPAAALPPMLAARVTPAWAVVEQAAACVERSERTDGGWKRGCCQQPFAKPDAVLSSIVEMTKTCLGRVRMTLHPTAAASTVDPLSSSGGLSQTQSFSEVVVLACYCATWWEEQVTLAKCCT